MSEPSLGQLIDQLGVTMDSLRPEQQITDLVILAKTVDMENGAVSLYTSHSDGISWIEKLGMLRAAEKIENAGYREAEDDE